MHINCWWGRLLQTATLKTNEDMVFAVDLIDPVPVQRYSGAGLANFNPQEGHIIFKDLPEGRTCV